MPVSPGGSRGGPRTRIRSGKGGDASGQGTRQWGTPLHGSVRATEHPRGQQQQRLPLFPAAFWRVFWASAGCGMRGEGGGCAAARIVAGKMNPRNASNLQERSREERGSLVFVIETGKQRSSALLWHPGSIPRCTAQPGFGAGPRLGNGAGEAAVRPSGLGWISHPRIPLSGMLCGRDVAKIASSWHFPRRKGYP